ncbi:carbonic anhydrase [Deinococcus sp. NW-56]|uniref:carbonic anhydrase n=1 Tax=Deinococcus sp. NW-56 TaxID=2080419 RepID=UPI0018F87A9F|nr:carbonic anhydrase [Deinococcus sp. NW-56]
MPGKRGGWGVRRPLRGPKYPAPRDAHEALERLQAGNRRFRESRPLRPHGSVRRREGVAAQGQHPFAVVVACADSREAPELLFDCGLGDLFVVRTAGHVVGDTALGSVEFAALNLGVDLVVVLGHSHCGAVGATLEAEASGQAAPGHLGALIRAISPAVTLARGRGGDLPEATLRAHVELSAAAIRASEVLRPRLEVGTLRVVGGRYDLETGEVVFFGDEAAPLASPLPPQPTVLGTPGPLETCLYAHDLDAAEAFYSGVLGLSLYGKAPGRHLFYRLSGGMLLVFNPGASAQPGQVPAHAGAEGGHACLRIAREATEAWHAHLTACGLEVTRYAWGTRGESLYFRDPAGNVLELAPASIWGLGDGGEP